MRTLFSICVIHVSVQLIYVLGNDWAPLLEDNTAILDVPGRTNVNALGWADSYSVGDSCYCVTTFDHNIGDIEVDTPLGTMTVREVCELLGPGPGADGRPRYNDIQCGNGPANDAGDEDDCPGRTEYGQEGCGYIGPKWNFEPHMDDYDEDADPPVNNPSPETPSLLTDLTQIVDVPGDSRVVKGWADSYSVGNECYCDSNYDHGISDVVVDTPFGDMTVKEVCDMLGPGPGATGRPRYNDIQCGNGPANNAGDEDDCPGRVEFGINGCKYVGPKWNFDGKSPTDQESSATSTLESFLIFLRWLFSHMLG